ncbi:hypothetical protein OKW21_004947 [Catalinimonas alkaloidigena]|nr:hypothetical protein [Catalinimonas alkaloidigena]
MGLCQPGDRAEVATHEKINLYTFPEDPEGKKLEGWVE